MMDSSILIDREDHDTVMTSPPPTRVITVKNEYSVKDQDEMLALAQKKFDRMRQKNRERARSSRYQRLSRNSRLSKGIHNNQEQTKVNQLLSSLLYLSLMMHKVDKMKKILEHHDSNLYNEWVILLGSLHSPVFHMRERRIQNDRVKKIFSRKNRYKCRYEETRSDLEKSQDTLKEMSLALAQQTEENKRINSSLHDKQSVESDLAASTKESEILQSHLSKLEEEINSYKSERSELHSKVESLQLKQGQQLQIIRTLEKDQEGKQAKILSLEDELNVQKTHNKELECQIIALQKDSDMHRKELNLEKLNHESSKETGKEECAELQSLLTESNTSLKDLERSKDQEIRKLNEDIGSVVKELEMKKSQWTMTKNELRQTREDLDLKATTLSNTLSLLESERKTNYLLQEKNTAAINEIGSLNLSVEEKRSETIALVQTIASLESQLKSSISEAANKFSSLDKDLKSKEGKLIQTEKEISNLICTNQSLEKSLSEALLSKHCAEEQKQKLLDGEIKSVNISIEEMAAENLRITNMMESMKDSLMQDVHNALQQQTEAEGKAKLLQKDLVQSEKEVAVLRCENASLEKSLSEVTQLKTCVEEQKQKLIDGESNSVNTSIAKLTAENLRINNMMGSMKDNLMKDIHDALEQQKAAQQKVDKLQTELIKCEKEVAELRARNISLEQSLAEALHSRLEAETKNKEFNESNAGSVNSSIQRLSSENERLLSEMMGSMRESLVKDVLDVLSHHKEDMSSTKQSQPTHAKNHSSSSNSSHIDEDGAVLQDEIDNVDITHGAEKDIKKDDIISIQANEVVLEVVADAIDKISLNNTS